MTVLLVTVLSVGPALAGKPPTVFECEGCEVQAPLREAPGLGDLISTKGGSVLVPGDQCVRELEFLSEAVDWADWSRKRKTAQGLPVEARDIAAYLPVKALSRRGKEVLLLRLVDAEHRSIPIGGAERVLGDGCITAMTQAVCEHGNLDELRMVTDVFGAGTAVVRSDNGFDETDIEQMDPKAGVAWNVSRTDPQHLAINGGELLVVGFKTQKVDPGAGDLDDMKKGCPARR